MTATKSWTIHCDGCGDSLGDGDLGAETAAEARRQAANRGAVVRPGGRDYCDECKPGAR